MPAKIGVGVAITLGEDDVAVTGSNKETRQFFRWGLSDVFKWGNDFFIWF